MQRKRLWNVIAVLLLLLGVIACRNESGETAVEIPAATAAAPIENEAETPVPTTEHVDEIVIRATPEATKKPVPTLLPTPAPTPTPTPTPIPSPVYVTVGAIGDIMAPSAIIEDVRTEEGLYDFSTLFLPMRDLFESVDLMCANLEVPLAGEKGGYSGKKDARTGLFSFNAPDSLLDTLKAYGVDLLTTANNHSFDRGIDGLRRTVQVIREAGFYQTGTYLNEEERQKPCVIEINGVKVGIVASTRLMNQAYIDVNRSEAYQAFGYYMCDGSQLTEECKASIARVREAGAEFVILFAHWDYENDNPTASDTKSLARQAMIAGADCIIGSHPHRIKSAEYITVEREDGPYTGLVLYSLGNFTANQEFTCMVGLFSRITLKKDFETNTVTLVDAGVLPTLTVRRSGEKPRFMVLPVYADPSMIMEFETPLTDSELKLLENARALAFKRLGKVEGLRVLDEPAEEKQPEE